MLGRCSMRSLIGMGSGTIVISSCAIEDCGRRETVKELENTIIVMDSFTTRDTPRIMTIMVLEYTTLYLEQG